MIKHRMVHLLAAFVAVGYFLTLPVSVNANLNVDFSTNGPLQAGWEAFDHATDGGAPVTKTFSNPLGVGGMVDVTMSGNTHFRSYVEVTGSFAALSDLLRDGPLCNDVCELNLGLTNLQDGSYDITMFHHTTRFGPSERPLDTFDVRLTDGVVNDLLVFDEVEESDNASDLLSTSTFAFDVVGGSPVNIVLDRSVNSRPAGGMHITLAAFELRGVPSNPVLCDFNDDTFCNTADIDLLNQEIFAGTNGAAFDMTGNGLVDLADQDTWRAEAATENGFDEPYLKGDSDLSGDVVAADLNNLGRNWQQAIALWSEGDFDASGFVDAGDLNLLGIEWQGSIGIAAGEAVPEPSGLALLLLGGLVFVVRRRRR